MHLTGQLWAVFKLFLFHTICFLPFISRFIWLFGGVVFWFENNGWFAAWCCVLGGANKKKSKMMLQLLSFILESVSKLVFVVIFTMVVVFCSLGLVIFSIGRMLLNLSSHPCDKILHASTQFGSHSIWYGWSMNDLFYAR